MSLMLLASRMPPGTTNSSVQLLWTLGVVGRGVRRTTGEEGLSRCDGTRTITGEVGVGVGDAGLERVDDVDVGDGTS